MNQELPDNDFLISSDGALELALPAYESYQKKLMPKLMPKKNNNLN